MCGEGVCGKVLVLSTGGRKGSRVLLCPFPGGAVRVCRESVGQKGVWGV